MFVELSSFFVKKIEHGTKPTSYKIKYHYTILILKINLCVFLRTCVHFVKLVCIFANLCVFRETCVYSHELVCISRNLCAFPRTCVHFRELVCILLTMKIVIDKQKWLRTFHYMFKTIFLHSLS